MMYQYINCSGNYLKYQVLQGMSFTQLLIKVKLSGPWFEAVGARRFKFVDDPG
jgi:hypothetical protein